MLIGRSKKTVKKIRVFLDSTATTYFYEKSTKQLFLIEVVSLDNTRKRWWYNYHFLNGKLVMLNKYNGQPIRNGKGANAFYYYKNDILVFQEENKTQMQNIASQQQVASDMKLNAPKY